MPSWDRRGASGILTGQGDRMAAERRLVLAVFIDGYGWRLSRRFPLLEGVLSYRAPLATQFGYSCTCDPTILTGVLPRDHGHFSFFVYDPARSPFRALRVLDLLPSAVVDRARVRGWISRVVGAGLGYTGYFQLYNVPFPVLPLLDYTEKRDLYRPGGILGGQETVFDRLRARGVPYHVSDWRRAEAANLSALKAEVLAGRIRLGWLFLGGLDGVLHAHGTAARQVGDLVARYDAALRGILDAARARYDPVVLHVFSDHGMHDVVATCDLQARVRETGLQYGVDYAAVYDSTMARFWFQRDGARERVVAALAREPRGRILDDETLAGWGCDFPDRRYGELFFLADPGVLIVPSHMGLRPIPGMHGYAPDDPDSVAFYGTTAPDGPRPERLTDLKPRILGDVGV